MCATDIFRATSTDYANYSPRLIESSPPECLYCRDLVADREPDLLVREAGISAARWHSIFTCLIGDAVDDIAGQGVASLGQADVPLSEIRYRGCSTNAHQMTGAAGLHPDASTLHQKILVEGGHLDDCGFVHGVLSVAATGESDDRAQ